ncbi:MAG: hypothetical protein P4L50_17545 [Anaerolineaceae bacterium]|nr:hypothetical protein [Anaerolineaceae bacterium]
MEIPDPNIPAPEEPTKPKHVRRRIIRPEKIGPAFWTVSSIISMVVNIFLIAVIILLGRELFSLKQILSNQLIGGLYNNFVLMDQASIHTTIPIDTTVPAKFNLTLDKDTIVTLTKNTPLEHATVSLATGGLTINSAPTNIILPAGTNLPVHLKMVIPVDQKIPVKLNVDVNIPLNQTDLHTPFVGLQNVLKPYSTLLDQAPDSWHGVFCASPNGLICQWWMH